MVWQSEIFWHEWFSKIFWHSSTQRNILAWFGRAKYFGMVWHSEIFWHGLVNKKEERCLGDGRWGAAVADVWRRDAIINLSLFLLFNLALMDSQFLPVRELWTREPGQLTRWPCHSNTQVIKWPCDQVTLSLCYSIFVLATPNLRVLGFEFVFVGPRLVSVESVLVRSVCRITVLTKIKSGHKSVSRLILQMFKLYWSCSISKSLCKSTFESTKSEIFWAEL